MKTQRPEPAHLQVGHYRLLTKIGEGGMGVVHLARAPDGRRVALKVLRPHVIGDDEARERLSREVSSLRRVRSPRIAEVLDADPWGETPFVATRYVPGLSLHQHVREAGPIGGADLRWFATGLAEAVIAVHNVGVLHRDIKPSNVLLEGRSPVLIDFGLARLAEDPRLTHTGWLLGTPGYLAPEILYGEDATAASDVHSWAATVVFAATGRPPFGTGPAMAIMDRVRRGEHDLSGVPVDLLPLVRACLAADPRDRPETAAVLASLRGPRPVPARDELTMPFSLLGPEDRADTRVLGPEPVTGVLAAAPTSPQPQHTRLAPFEPASLEPAPRAHTGPARGLMLLGLFLLVVTGFARAPYLCLAALAVAALTVRTASWTTESGRNRVYRRGRSRWYDGPLTLASAPWYLVVATPGTLVLLLSAVVLTFVAGTAYLLFGLPVLPGLLLMGAVLGVSLWWGPGSRRLRTPTRRLATSLTRRPGPGWVGLLVLAVALALCGYALATGGVVWDPQPGPPWRPGTMLGDLGRYL